MGALYRNLLGPRKGVNEVIEEPYLQYQLGILNSAQFDGSGNNTSKDLTAVADVNPDAAEVYEESISAQTRTLRLDADEVQDSGSLRQEVDTDLSFALGAVSLGLHFVLKGKSPKFKVCLTWARYRQRGDLGVFPHMFERHPKYFVSDWINAADNERSVEVDSKDVEHGVWLYVLPKKIPDAGRWIVRVFMVNKTGFKRRQKETNRVFQPQIRVIADDSSELAALDQDSSIQDGEETYDDDTLSYLELRTKARGHMCAAVWSDVDPEGDKEGEIGNISWPDGSFVPRNVRDEFTHPLVRTEYMPLYTVLQPNPSNLTFNAGVLSNMWEPDSIERELVQITTRFSKWIDNERKKMDRPGFPQQLKNIACKHMEECRDTNARICEGINFLMSNERGRAAFCFMNAVMNDKRRNETDDDSLNWREFQMAFILQSLRGVSGESRDERDLADVLWFPTGGGKTEAYLGIMIFSLAYRRLTPPTRRATDGGVAAISRYTLRLLTIQQFQRALGAIVAADVRRVENWMPNGLKEGNQNLSDPYMEKRFNEGMLWGSHRFSIGLWIGGGTTPNDFAWYRVKHGKVLLNCEGALLPTYDERRQKLYEVNGDPAQIQECPICGNLLCMAKEYVVGKTVEITWVIKLRKPIDKLNAIPQKHFENLKVTLNKNPVFDLISDLPNGDHFYYFTVELGPKKNSGRLDRETVDNWWKDTVVPTLAGEGVDNPLQSTSPSMPGYFFLSVRGAPRPHDFEIYCTNKKCKLNQTEWFEISEKAHAPLVPKPFATHDGRSRSVPISAYTTDEQVYFKCPSFVLSTVDKFANLPFEPRCASLFGNVDAFHPDYGYGRRGTIESPTRMRNGKRAPIPHDEIIGVDGFAPPSLILQDELHLIEGPLGSMVGVYEMAVDVLTSNESKPKYIASSATIKESESQVGTIFRRGVKRFPPPGIDSSSGYFSKVDQDIKCTSDCPGRLYMGMATTKSTVTLPIRIQSTVMSEIFKIYRHPSAYGLSDNERSDLIGAVDPYWSFVTYFTDLQLMSKFNNYYDEDITNNVQKWSVVKSHNSTERIPVIDMPRGMRLFRIRASHNMKVTTVSVYCGKPPVPTIDDQDMTTAELNATDNETAREPSSADSKNELGGTARIAIAIYSDGKPVGKIVRQSEANDWKIGENVFELNDGPLEISKGESVWVCVVNSTSATFQAVKSSKNDSLVVTLPHKAEIDFPESIKIPMECSSSSIMVSINEDPRRMDQSKNIRLSSATTSEELAHSLEELKTRLYADSLQTSPVFGTGIDIDRLGVMTVMNQPKTNSGYIQATGRVGRTSPGLIISWLRASRARDLNHYENFIGYHMALHRFVEPVTASPFSSKAMSLCLGPILVALLRNARNVGAERINEGWASSKTGPLWMANHGDAAEIASIKDALTEISQSRFVPGYRKIRSADFKRLFDIAKAAWKGVATDMECTGEALQYDERKPNALPVNNVVLGTPGHEDQKLEFCYENVPNSLRQTELTSSFYSDDDVVTIRPSQFITKYGPGSLIPGKSVTWVVPSVEDLISALKTKPSFSEPDTQGQIELKKYEVVDNQMRRILHRLNPRAEWKNLMMFQLPSNTSLAMPNLEKLYRCKIVSTWGICHNAAHHSKVLGRIVQVGLKRVVLCPKCEKVSGCPESEKFFGVRYLAACKKGHLGDINWPYEVHRNKKCDGEAFEWRTFGGNDNAEIVCTKCGKSTNYLELMDRSNRGQIACSGRFAESGKTDICEKINGRSQAKMVSKGLMSLKLPIIMTTLKIPGHKGTLIEYYESIALALDTYIGIFPNYTKDGLVSWMNDQRNNKKAGFTRKLVDLTMKASDREIRAAVEYIKKITTVDGQREESMSEVESLQEELHSLESQTHDRGTGAQIGTDTSPPDNRFPIRFGACGLRFEAMPFDNIRVTQVQTGYTREVPSPADSGQSDSGIGTIDTIRIGEPVRSSSKYKDPSDNIWYVANQLVGEGVFIHLDPTRYANASEVLSNTSKSHAAWSGMHMQVKQRNEARIRSEGRKDGTEQIVDALNMEIVRTHPLFVWWHTFAHEFINQLAIDSGFTGTSLGERIYCVERDTGQFSAGLLIYAVSPGADGTLGGLTSLVDKDVLPKIVKKTLSKISVCSVDPLCSDTPVHEGKRHGAACHVCLMNSETSCGYQNKFLDRNVVMEAIASNAHRNR